MVDISRLTLSFKDEKIFKDFSLSVKKGEKVAITGESGKGKSSLLNVLAGFVPDFKGTVSVFDIRLSSSTISEIRKNIAWLPQDTSLNMKNVGELFYAPFDFGLHKDKKPKEKEVSKIFNCFELSENLLTKKIKEISGGQKQRIILASCILLKKPLLLADEPTSALDEVIKKKVVDYILSIKNLTVIVATHDEYWIRKSDKQVQL